MKCGPLWILPQVRGPSRQSAVLTVFGNATKEGKEVESGEYGTGIGPRFCSSVLHGQEGSLTGCMQWQGSGQS